MNDRPANNNTKWLVAAIVAAVVLLCGAMFVCGAAAFGAFLIGQRQVDQVYRNFPLRPLSPNLRPERVLPVIPDMPQQPVKPNEVFPFQMNGALVQEVIPDSPADKAGIQPGDMITAIAGEAITPEKGLVALVQAHKPGDTVTVTYWRLRGPRRGEFSAEIKLAENPDLPGRAYLGVRAMDLFMEP